MKKLRIGLFGFGVVGEGIYRVLTEKTTLNCEIVRVCIKDPDKPRNAPAHLFTTDKRLILDDPTVDVVVELIDDAEAAYAIVTTALRAGKAVVSANKKMIAAHHPELIALQQQHGTSFLYEAAVCGSVPIIRNLEEYFDNDLLNYVTGIVNGSTNYILTQMSSHGTSFAENLKIAQANGFAESDPTMDVEGHDAASKLSIICLHAFGKRIAPAAILRKGITAIKPIDLSFAREKGLTLKLIASTRQTGDRLSASVLPTFLPQGHTLARVHNEFNGLLIGSTLADEQFLYGKGAGRYPTSSAVLSDISALRYRYQYEYRKGHVADEPARSGTGKFYLSYPRGTAVDLGLFDDIHEQYANHATAYVIGTVALEKLHTTDFWQSPDISLIQFGE